MNDDSYIAIIVILCVSFLAVIYGITNQSTWNDQLYQYTKQDCSILLGSEKVVYDGKRYDNSTWKDDPYFLRMWYVQNCNKYFELEKEFQSIDNNISEEWWKVGFSDEKHKLYTLNWTAGTPINSSIIYRYHFGESGKWIYECTVRDDGICN